MLDLIDSFARITAKNPYISPNDDRPTGATPPLGWSKFREGQWAKISSEGDLPSLLVFDVESSRIAKDEGADWDARLATAFGCDSAWYAWVGLSEVIPFPPGRVVIGHNILEHDANFLSCTYTHPGETIFVDTRMLAAAIVGIPEGLRPLWTKLKGQAFTTGGGHPWVANCCDLGLSALAEGVLGRKIVKGIVSRHEATFSDKWNFFQPRLLVSYCCQDVEVTHALFRRLWPQFVRAVGEDVASGCLELGRETVLVNKKSQLAHLRVQQAANDLRIEELVERAIALEQNNPAPLEGLDRSSVIRGPNKGEERWALKIRKAGLLACLPLICPTYQGLRCIQQRDSKTSRATATWVCGRTSLGTKLLTVDRLKSGDLGTALPRTEALGTEIYAAAAERQTLKTQISQASELHSVGGVSRLPLKTGDPATLIQGSRPIPPSLDQSVARLGVRGDRDRLPLAAFSDGEGLTPHLLKAWPAWVLKSRAFDLFAKSAGGNCSGS